MINATQSTLWAYFGHTQRSLKYTSEITQRSLRDHSENTHFTQSALTSLDRPVLFFTLDTINERWLLDVPDSVEERPKKKTNNEHFTGCPQYSSANAEERSFWISLTQRQQRALVLIASTDIHFWLEWITDSIQIYLPNIIKGHPHWLSLSYRE